MKRFNADDQIVSVSQEESPLHDSHVTEYKRHNGIYDSHVECRDRFKASLHDSHVERYFEHLAKTKPSHYRKTNGQGMKAQII